MRSKPPKGKKEQDSGRGFEIPAFFFLLWIGLYIVSFGLYMTGTMSFSNLLKVTVVCQCIGAVGILGIYFSAFRESVGAGLCCLFVPFYFFYYMFTRWDESQPWSSISCVNFLVNTVFFGLVFTGVSNENLAEIGIDLKHGPVTAAVHNLVAPKKPGQMTDVEREAFARRFIARTDEAAAILESINTIDDARAVAPKLAQMLRDEKSDGARADREPALKDFDDDELDRKYIKEAIRSRDRVSAATRRLKMIPGVHEALALSEFGQELPWMVNQGMRERHRDRGIPDFGPRGPGTPPDFGFDVHPEMRQPPSDAVVIEVSGLSDSETREVFTAKFDAHIKAYADGSASVSTGSGDQRTYRIWPIANVRDFADRIDFAKVVNVAPKSIRLHVDPLKDSERRPKAEPGKEIDVALFDLKSDVIDKKKQALGVLSRIPVNVRREEVARAIEPLLLSNDVFLQSDAIKAIGHWGGKENTRALVALLSDRNGMVRNEVCEALKTIKDPSCAEAVAALLTIDRRVAIETLAALGSDAEPFVLKYLQSGDVFVRMDVCKLLKSIGTEASIKPLRLLIRATNGSGFDADAARDALFWINASIAEKKGKG